MKKSLQSLCNELENLVPNIMSENKVEGLSMVLIDDDKIVWKGMFGWADKEDKMPVTAETVFEAASITKPFVAYATLKLFKEKKLDLNKPLSEYLTEPYIEDEPFLNEPISAFNVLSHTTGLPNWREEGKPLECIFEPGKRFRYSGEGYVFLQRVIEQITGLEFNEFLMNTFCKKLKMEYSNFKWTDKYELSKATGYKADGEKINKRRFSKEANAAGSLHTTPTELAYFLIHMMKGGDNQIETEIIDEMLTPHVPINNLGLGNRFWPDWPEDDPLLSDKVFWGLGWGIERSEKGEAFWHWGDNSQYHAYCLGIKKEKKGVVMMTNSENGSKMWEIILDKIFGGTHPAIVWLDEGKIV